MILHDKVRDLLETTRERFRLRAETLLNVAQGLPEIEAETIRQVAYQYNRACECCIAILDGKEYDPEKGRAV